MSGDEADIIEDVEELIDEDEDYSETWRRASAVYSLYRFKPGLWLSSEIPNPLFQDLTNYPYEIRDAVLSCILENVCYSDTFVRLSAILRVDENGSTLFGADAARLILERRLMSIWSMVTLDTPPPPVEPDEVLPRFIWFKSELEKLYGPTLIKEAPPTRTHDSETGLNAFALSEDTDLPVDQDSNNIDLATTAEDSEEVKVAELPTFVNVPTTVLGSTATPLVVPQTRGPMETTLTELLGPGEPLSAVPSTLPIGDDSVSALPDQIDNDEAKINQLIVIRKKKKRVTLVQQTSSIPTDTTIPTPYMATSMPSNKFDKPDALSVTLQDMQFRLARHGTVADPRSYLGKGDTSYDKDDPFFDDEALVRTTISSDRALQMQEIGLTKEDLDARLDQSADSDLEEGDSNASFSSGEDDYPERAAYAYENREEDFFMDNRSEVSEVYETVEAEEEAENKAKATLAASQPAGRIITVVDMAKPTSFPIVFNPKGWRSVKTKMNLPPLVCLFLSTLELVVPRKRWPYIQRSIFETAELAVVCGEDKTSVALNDEGVKLVTEFLHETYKAAFTTFLIPFGPIDSVEGVSDVELPRHCKVLLARLADSAETKAAFCHGYCECDGDQVDILDEVLRTYISPYGPKKETWSTWWWTSIANHTFRVFCAQEDLTYHDLEAFFQTVAIDINKMNERIKAWSGRVRQLSKFKPRGRASSVDIDLETPSPDNQMPVVSLPEESPNNDLKLLEHDLEQDDREFSIFDPLSSVITKFTISFNVRRNVFREIADSANTELTRILYYGATKEDLEKAFSGSWATKIIALMEDASEAILKSKLRTIASWWDVRLRRYKRELKITNLHDKRKVKNQTKVVTSVQTKLNNSILLPKPKASITPKPAKTQGNGGRTMVRSLVQFHGLARMLAMIQMSPQLLPMELTGIIKDPNNSLLSTTLVVTAINSVSEQHCTLRSVAPEDHPMRELVGMKFDNIADALQNIERKIKNLVGVVNSALRQQPDPLRAWQVFQVPAAKAALPKTCDLLRWPSQVALLDLVAIHYWSQSIAKPTTNNHVLISPVFVHSNEIQTPGPPRSIVLPQDFAAAIIASKHDLVESNDSVRELDRWHSGQISAITQTQAFIISFTQAQGKLPKISTEL